MCVYIYIYIHIYLFGHTTGLQDLSSPTRNGIGPSAVKAWSPDH